MHERDETQPLTREELEAQEGDELPDRLAMSLIVPRPVAPFDPDAPAEVIEGPSPDGE
jgi:hypothetical protein